MLVHTVSEARRLPFLSSVPVRNQNDIAFILVDRRKLRIEVVVGSPNDYNSITTSVVEITDAALEAYLDLEESPKVSVSYLRILLNSPRSRNYHDSHLRKSVAQFLCDRVKEAEFNWGQPD